MKQKLNKKMMTLMIAIILLLSVSISAIAAVEDTGFSDVAADAWYAEAVEYVTDNDLMSGTSATTFEPNTNTSRAMLTTILYREAGSPDAQASSFTDVADGTWYSDAVDWASANDIVSGYNDGRFAPNEPVTREQLASILWRVEGSPATGDSQAFADQASISSYAVNAVAWARANNIISGRSSNVFAPAGLATRAETAAILHRYLTADSRPNTPVVPDTSVSSETAITITVGDTVIAATLNDSVSTRDLVSRMPFTTDMTRGTVDYYASLSDPLDFDEADRHNGWHNGDIGFDGTYLTMFYDGETTSGNSENQITLGRVSNLALLNGLGSSVKATFALAEEADQTTPDTTAHRTLVVYFSHSQRSKGVAELLQEKVDGDIYELIPAEPYSGSDSTIGDRSTEEIESGNLPDFAGTLPDLSQYDTILVGGPVWNYTVSAPIRSYLAQADFSGKTVAPFWTDQGGSGDYAKTFTAAVRNAGRITDFLQLSNTPSMSEADKNTRLDDWLKGVLL